MIFSMLQDGATGDSTATDVGRRAFVAYWLLLGLTVVVWIAAAASAGGTGRAGIAALLRQPLWLIALVGPPALAAVDLIVYRRNHEIVCALEARRHGWFDLLVNGGYSARTFALTGWAMLAGLAVLLAWAFLGGS